MNMNSSYAKVLELFDRIVELLGEENVSLKEFNRIVAAGFEEMKVGLLPPTSDCVMIGDIERTRLDNVKVLFFAGVNDGVVPKKNENCSGAVGNRPQYTGSTGNRTVTFCKGKSIYTEILSVSDDDKGFTPAVFIVCKKKQ